MRRAKTMYDRRTFLGSAAVMGFLQCSYRAEAVSLVDLKGLGDVIDALSGSLGKIADSISHVISLGDRGYTEVKARAALSALKDLDSRLTFLASATQTAMIRNFQDYIDLGREALKAGRDEKERYEIKLRGSWSAIVQAMTDIVQETTNLLSVIKNDRSDFILDAAYGALADALNEKIGILNTLKSTNPPSSAAELDKLEDISIKYDNLRRKTLDAVYQLSKYIRMVQQNKP